MSLSLYISHNPSFPRAAPAHLHDKPQTLCSIQGACSWDNPAQKRRKKTCVQCTKEDRREQHLNLQSSGIGYKPDGCSPPLQPRPFKHLRLQGKQGR